MLRWIPRSLLHPDFTLVTVISSRRVAIELLQEPDALLGQRMGGKHVGRLVQRVFPGWITRCGTFRIDQPQHVAQGGTVPSLASKVAGGAEIGLALKQAGIAALCQDARQGASGGGEGDEVACD